MNQNDYQSGGMQGYQPQNTGVDSTGFQMQQHFNYTTPQVPYSGTQNQGYADNQGLMNNGYSFQPQQNFSGGSYIPQTPYSPGYTSPGYQPPSGYQMQTGYQAPAGYQASAGYRPPTGYQAPGGYQAPSGFQNQNSYQAGFQSPGGYQAQAGFQPQPMGAYQAQGGNHQAPPGYQQEYAAYSAYSQMGKGAVPLNGGGYIPQKVPVHRRPFQLSDIHLIIAGIVLIALFAASVIIFRSNILKCIFLLLALGSSAVLWIKPLTADNKRITYTIIALALCILTAVSFMLKKPGNLNPAKDTTTQADSGSGSSSGTNNTENLKSGSQSGSVYSITSEPDVTATPEPTDNALLERLVAFFAYWSANRQDDMLELCAPSWRSKMENPRTSLFALLANRTPLNCKPESITGTDADDNRRVTLTSKIDRNNGKDPEVYRMTVLMVKDNYEWYIDPQSLQTNELLETPDPNITPTPGPTSTPETYPSTILYYNPKNGEYYHRDPYCKVINEKYTPLQGQFTFAEINTEPYSKLKPCNVCGAPLRDD